MQLTFIVVIFAAIFAPGTDASKFSSKKIKAAIEKMTPEQYDQVSEIAELNKNLVQHSAQGDYDAIRRACDASEFARVVCHNRAINWWLVADSIEASVAPPSEEKQRRTLRKLKSRAKRKMKTKIKSWIPTKDTYPVTIDPTFAEESQSELSENTKYAEIEAFFNELNEQYDLKNDGVPDMQGQGLVKRANNPVAAIFKAIARGIGVLIGFPIGVIATVLTVLMLSVGGLLICVASLVAFTVSVVNGIAAIASLGILYSLGITQLIGRLTSAVWGMICIGIICVSGAIAGLFGGLGVLAFKLAGIDLDLKENLIDRPLDKLGLYF